MTTKPRVLVSELVLSAFIAGMCPAIYSQSILDDGAEPLVPDAQTWDALSLDFVFNFGAISDSLPIQQHRPLQTKCAEELNGAA